MTDPDAEADTARLRSDVVTAARKYVEVYDSADTDEFESAWEDLKEATVLLDRAEYGG